jgi:hypothetical protein
MTTLRGSTTSEAFLTSEAGQAFARAMIDGFAREQSKAAAPLTAGTPEERFEALIGDFFSVLKQHVPLVDPNFDAHLREVYSTRYFDLYPYDNELQAELFYRRLAGATFVLALLTVNCWKLENGKLGGYKAVRNRNLGVFHLQWARDAFGFWRANLEKIPYYLDDLKRDCPPPKTIEALLGLVDDAAREALRAQSRAPHELEDGCEIC